MPRKVNCYVCGKENLLHNEIGINKKLLGGNIKAFHCMQCLAEFLDITVSELEERIEEFKDAGCVLFN